MTVIDPRDPASVASFVRSCGLAVVATTGTEQRPEAALVRIAALDDGTLIFDTRPDTRKVSNLRQNAYAAVVVGWHDGVSVQIEGIAEVTTGRRREERGDANNDREGRHTHVVVPNTRRTRRTHGSTLTRMSKVVIYQAK